MQVGFCRLPTLQRPPLFVFLPDDWLMAEARSLTPIRYRLERVSADTDLKKNRRKGHKISAGRQFRGARIVFARIECEDTSSQPSSAPLYVSCTSANALERTSSDILKSPLPVSLPRLSSLVLAHTLERDPFEITNQASVSRVSFANALRSYA
jgi:hypothetical protein